MPDLLESHAQWQYGQESIQEKVQSDNHDHNLAVV
jgi:hypothetical protein